MRRLFKLFGFVAGVLATLWMLRDRLVSITAAREPEPPTFRPASAARPTPSPAATVTDLDPTAKAPTPADLPEDADLERIKGVGPVFANRLRSAGLGSFEALGNAAAETVAEAAGVSVSRATGWIEAARHISA